MTRTMYLSFCFSSFQFPDSTVNNQQVSADPFVIPQGITKITAPFNLSKHLCIQKPLGGVSANWHLCCPSHLPKSAPSLLSNRGFLFKIPLSRGEEGELFYGFNQQFSNYWFSTLVLSSGTPADSPGFQKVQGSLSQEVRCDCQKQELPSD